MKTILRIAVVAAIASVLVMSLVNTRAFAADEVLATGSVDDILIKAVFHFRDGDETVNSFQIFDTQGSGFNRKVALSFMLEGVIGWDRPMLYKAIDDYYQYGRNTQYDNAEFDVDVILHRKNVPYREIDYKDCQVKNYDVLTEAKPEKAFGGKSTTAFFAYVDKVFFDCRGYEPQNPVYTKMQQDKVDKATKEALANIDQSKQIKKEQQATIAKYTMLAQLGTYDLEPKQNSLPLWVLQNAQWMKQGKISPEEYRALQEYLVSKGILKI